MSDLTTAPIDDLVAQLAALDPPLAVTMNPADVNPPGGWLNIDEIRTLNLSGDLELRCSLYLIAPDQDPKRALGILGPMLTRLRGVWVPDGPVVPQGVVLPDTPTPVPALRVPVHLHTESEVI
jgi:hypothetical protein